MTLNPQTMQRSTRFQARSTWLTAGVGAIASAITFSTMQSNPALALTYNPTPTTFASNLSSPNGVAVIPGTGDVWITSTDLRRYASNGSLLSTYNTQSAYRGITVSGNEVLVVDGNNQRVLRFDSTSGASLGSFNTNSSLPQNIVAIPGTNDVLISVNNFLPTPSRVERYSSSGQFQGTFGSGYSSPRGIAFDPLTGDVLVANSGNNTVSRFDSNGNFRSIFGSGYNSPWGIVIDSSGDVLVSNSDRVLRFDPSGVLQQTLTLANISRPMYMTFDTDGSLLVAEQDSRIVSRFTVATPVPFGFSPIWLFASFGLRPLIRRFSNRKRAIAVAK